EKWARYLDYVRTQLTELLTNYGRIDLVWFDGHWERTAEEWRAAELRRLVASLQPDAIVNDRLPGNGDYDTPEQFLPITPPSRPHERRLLRAGHCARQPAVPPPRCPTGRERRRARHSGSACPPGQSRGCGCAATLPAPSRGVRRPFARVRRARRADH